MRLEGQEGASEGSQGWNKLDRGTSSIVEQARSDPAIRRGGARSDPAISSIRPRDTLDQVFPCE